VQPLICNFGVAPSPMHQFSYCCVCAVAGKAAGKTVAAINVAPASTH
jgi:hypothetical protein